MTEVEVLLSVLATLNDLSIPYMLTGSYASNYYGQPRATGDADLVIEFQAKDIPRLVNVVQKDYYVSEQAALEAVTLHCSFNLIHLKTAFKIDLIVRKDRPFSLMEFSRRRRVNLWGTEIWVASPEDVILSKLEWSKQGGSEQKFQDALRAYQIQADVLDLPYLRRWAAELNITELLGLLHR